MNECINVEMNLENPVIHFFVLYIQGLAENCGPSLNPVHSNSDVDPPHVRGLYNQSPFSGSASIIYGQKPDLGQSSTKSSLVRHTDTLSSLKKKLL